MNQKNLAFSPLQPQDLSSLTGLQPDGWPDISPHFQFYLKWPCCKPFKLGAADEIMAIGTCIFHKTTAWLGHIIVHPNFRNSGYGTLMTRFLVEQAEQHQVHAISLIATELGEPVYTKLGFAKTHTYVFLSREEVIEGEKIEGKTSGGLANEILQLDKLASGEDRSELLRPFLAEAPIISSRGKVDGFYLPGLNEGMIVARTADAGKSLIRQRAQSKTFFILPEHNTPAVDFLISEGFELKKTAPRMSLGRQVDFRPEMLFQRIGGNLG